ncbi:MAG: hypothetical protein ABIB61_00355 [Candidatus Shapirobacteria bacterium]
MIKHIWSVICQKSLIDKETNNISLIEVLEEVSVNITSPGEINKKINIPFKYEVVNYWMKKGRVKDVDIRIRLVDPDQKVIKSFINRLSIPPDKDRMRSRLRILGLELTRSGSYTFWIEIKEEGKKTFKRVAELPLEVKLTKKALPLDPQKLN